MLFEQALEQNIRRGTLEVVFPDGRERRFGQGAPQAQWRINDFATIKRIATDPEFMLGQTYMDKGWDTPDLLRLLEVLTTNFPENAGGRLRHLARLAVAPLQQWNRRAASRRNVSRHYDLDESLFRRILDEDMQYSCAYFPQPDISLEQAQWEKKEHIRRKLNLSRDQRVLDIGCGWGGLAIHLARQAGVHVVGLTLSREQARVARDRVREAGLERLVEIRLEDYRDTQETFDRVVSVGMFEHVGARYYPTYFNAVNDRLAADGVALIHTIGRFTPPGTTNPWIARYIFPGGYIPAMSEAMAAVERSGLRSADVEVLRLHYAETLAHWQARFQRIRPDVVAEKGERFCRMWEFYLASSEAGFRWRDLCVFQFQLARDQRAVPLTRDYLYEDRRETVCREGVERQSSA